MESNVNKEDFIVYSQITNPGFIIFDGKTGSYIGHSRVTPTPESEQKLLDLLNFNQIPNSLTLLNITLSRPSNSYLPPAVNRKLSRIAILNLEALDQSSGEWIPIELRMRYDVLARGNLIGGLYHFDSAEIDNIELVDQKRIQI